MIYSMSGAILCFLLMALTAYKVGLNKGFQKGKEYQQGITSDRFVRDAKRMWSRN